MGEQQRGTTAEFDGKVPVADGIQGIFGRRIKAQQFGCVVPVNRETGAGQCSSAQRHDIDAFQAVHETFTITLQILEPGQHMVAEAYRHGDLQVGEARQYGVDFALCEIQQPGLQAHQFLADSVDLIAQVKAHVGGNLVVTRAAGMQFLARFPDQRCQSCLDVHVYIFQADRPFKFALFDVVFDLIQALQDGIALTRADHFDLFQHTCMRTRALDVVAIQASVKSHGSGKSLNKGIGRFGESTAPGFVAAGIFGHNGSGQVQRQLIIPESPVRLGRYSINQY